VPIKPIRSAPPQPPQLLPLPMCRWRNATRRLRRCRRQLYTNSFEKCHPSVSTIIYLADIPSFGATNVDLTAPYHCPEIRKGKAQDLKHAPAQR
jgi:hypothetical protein